LTSTALLGSGFGFTTQTIVIYSSGYSFSIATYNQTPTCGYIQTYTFEVDTIPSSGFQTKPFFYQVDPNTLRVSSNDFNLDSQTFTIRQTTLISSTVLTQTATVSFVDPCKSTVFVPQVIPSAYAFITPSRTPVIVSLPILSDTVS